LLPRLNTNLFLYVKVLRSVRKTCNPEFVALHLKIFTECLTLPMHTLMVSE